MHKQQQKRKINASQSIFKFIFLIEKQKQNKSRILNKNFIIYCNKKDEIILYLKTNKQNKTKQNK